MPQSVRPSAVWTQFNAWVVCQTAYSNVRVRFLTYLGMGYMNEISAGRIMRDAKLYEIGAGTSEIRKMVIGRAFNKEFLR